MARVSIRKANIEAAKLVSHSGLTEAAAHSVLSKARSLASSHNNTGELASHFSVGASTGPHGVTDYVVSNDDPMIGPIEFGHKTKSGKFVEGLHIMQRAAH